MKLSDLSPAPGSRKKNKRVGRGCGSGHGKTSCKGHKGQKSRAGGGTRVGFEGGQMPLHRRLPKRGFHNIFRKQFATINLSRLNEVSESIVTPELILKMGFIKNFKDGVKVLGDGEIKKPLTVKAHAFSASAKEKIIKAGGSADIIQGPESKTQNSK
jgi:large subunit ribosomal protein L15